jgi:diketogulonate reductase-like aldo/keto reductase
MNLKLLGGSGVMVPEIGLGAWRYSGGIEPLRRGIGLGATLIDTAEAYGTEAVVGEAIKGIRERVFVATKVSGSNLRHDDVLRAAEASLGRLAIDRIDLYQIHWPNGAVPIAETMRAMETLVDRGLVRFVGVSNFSVAELRAAQKAMRKYPIASNQVLYSLSRRAIEADLMPYCEANGVTIIAYTPLDSGRLTHPSDYPREGMRALGQVAGETGRTFAQVALNWCTAHASVIAIPKSANVARVVENCGASGWRLSAEQVRTLDTGFNPPGDDEEW